MDENYPQRDSSDSEPRIRRFVYRSIEPDTQRAHPMRRSTDVPREFQGLSGELRPPILLKMGVYLKLN